MQFQRKEKLITENHKDKIRKEVIELQNENLILRRNLNLMTSSLHSLGLIFQKTLFNQKQTKKGEL